MYSMNGSRLMLRSCLLINICNHGIVILITVTNVLITRYFKKELKFEDYLIDLPPSLRYSYSKFRCRNTKLPVETNTFYGNLGSDRCLLCPQDVVGDEFHYLFSCSYFGVEQNLLLKPYYRVNPSTFKMEELFNKSGSNKLNLCKLIKIIHDRFK